MTNPRRRNNPPNKSDTETNEREHVVQIKRKGRKRNGRDDKATFGAVKKIGLSCLALVTMIIGIAMYKTFLIKQFELETFPDNVPDFSDDYRTTAELLRLIVANAKDVIRFEKELADFSATRELDKFLGEHIRPMQDKLASLKSQTAGYEKMEHIAGGPTSFIESSTKELIHMEDNMGALYDKVAKIIVEERKRIGYFRESVNDVRFKAKHVMDLMMHPSLTEKAVYLIPMTGTSDGEAFELLKHILKPRDCPSFGQIGRIVR
ncbi:uncharacterized protein LOC110861713 [Folsomia candida]|uniref:uncharacterized protein LOC110861713 n=1 Tax=Folsomia candida TaxID=158441 RepID=UPI0016053BC4|nr:uncharacterized protein LOC110861713 [Folsomia candida]XP_035700781.1 uncharacterized protein LOC110861713 [Folsomia candida]